MTNYIATVYGAPGCQKCRATERFLNRLGITVLHEQIHDVPEAMSYMRAQGWAELPLVKIERPEGEDMYWHGLSVKDLDALKWLVTNH